MPDDFREQQRSAPPLGGSPGADGTPSDDEQRRALRRRFAQRTRTGDGIDVDALREARENGRPWGGAADASSFAD